jgi:hypothetical protein
MLEKSPVNVPEDHFYCIVCKTAKPFTVEGGFGGSLDLGGFMCEVHAHQDK